MSNFEIEIASLPDREKLVAEIYYKDQQWVEIFQERGELIIQFYSPYEGDYWEFPFNEAVEALEKARSKLLAIG